MQKPGTIRRISRSARRGFTLAEIVVVIVIIGVLAALIVPRLFGRIGQSKQAAAGANATSLASALVLCRTDLEGLPSGASIDILFECPSGVDKAKWEQNGPYVTNRESLNDPWGKKFILIIPGKKNIDFDVVSYGADGVPGGEGENADIVKP